MSEELPFPLSFFLWCLGRFFSSFPCRFPVFRLLSGLHFPPSPTSSSKANTLPRKLFYFSFPVIAAHLGRISVPVERDPPPPLSEVDTIARGALSGPFLVYAHPPFAVLCACSSLPVVLSLRLPFPSAFLRQFPFRGPFSAVFGERLHATLRPMRFFAIFWLNRIRRISTNIQVFASLPLRSGCPLPYASFFLSTCLRSPAAQPAETGVTEVCALF